MKSAGFARLLGIAALSLSVSGCLWAPDLDRIRKDIERQIPGARFDREIAFSLGPVALALARGALSLSSDTREAGVYMRDLRSVGVAVYTARGLPGDFDLRLPRVLAGLVEKNGWEIAVKTREGDEAVWILCKEAEGTIEGLFVVALDGNELVLVRANGRIEEAFKRAIRENTGPGGIARSIRAGLERA